jgi:hypothetical protein
LVPISVYGRRTTGIRGKTWSTDGRISARRRSASRRKPEKKRASRRAKKLIDETFAGASPQVYFERYRTYLLALAPVITQQVLEVVGS